MQFNGLDMDFGVGKSDSIGHGELKFHEEDQSRLHEFSLSRFRFE